MAHTLPWSSGPAAGRADGDVVVMASRLKLKSLARVPRFFILSGGVLRQVQQSPGAVGLSLRADPWHKTFWTLSAWESRAALQEYIKTDPHFAVMSRLRSAMRESLFVSWKLEAGQLPSWAEADRRLAEQETAERNAGRRPA